MGIGFFTTRMTSMRTRTTMAPQENYLDVTDKRVTMWNREEMRKISGNAAPMEKNVAAYLRNHPNLEVYTGQDQRLSKSEVAARQSASNARVAVWNKKEGRVYSGNAAPLEKNVEEYLKKHPECEVSVCEGARGGTRPRVCRKTCGVRVH